MKEYRRAKVFANNQLAAFLEKKADSYVLTYIDDYEGDDISLTLPKSKKIFQFDKFPPFFDGLLPEGPQLEGLLKRWKIDRHDYFSQLMAVGGDLVGAINVVEDETP